jgi:hypothetical protein
MVVVLGEILGVLDENAALALKDVWVRVFLGSVICQADQSFQQTAGSVALLLRGTKIVLQGANDFHEDRDAVTHGASLCKNETQS